jgi:hypothetical protein
MAVLHFEASVPEKPGAALLGPLSHSRLEPDLNGDVQLAVMFVGRLKITAGEATQTQRRSAPY